MNNTIALIIVLIIGAAVWYLGGIGFSFNYGASITSRSPQGTMLGSST